MPGGADSLVHTRRCLERAALDIDDPPIALLDLDLRIAFPSLEWAVIRNAVQEFAPGLSQWTAWCHLGGNDVQLPCGDWIQCNRGAEQRDRHGLVYCALALATCAEAARRAVEAEGGWVWDV